MSNVQDKKFLDASGVTYLASLMNNFPTNSLLQNVIDAIQEALDEKQDDISITDDNSGNVSITIGQGG